MPTHIDQHDQGSLKELYNIINVFDLRDII